MLYLFTSTMCLTNNSVMNISGVSATEEVGRQWNTRLMETYRRGNIDEFIDLLMHIEDLVVHIDERPYNIRYVADAKDEHLRAALDKFFSDENRKKFKVGSGSVIEINIANAT